MKDQTAQTRLERSVIQLEALIAKLDSMAGGKDTPETPPRASDSPGELPDGQEEAQAYLERRRQELEDGDYVP